MTRYRTSFDADEQAVVKALFLGPPEDAAKQQAKCGARPNADNRRFGSVPKRMNGLEPSTFCMART